MELIYQYVDILDAPKDLEKKIEIAGRTCYKSEDRITDDSAATFVRGLVKSGHHAMIEFGDITVRFITNRGVTHEMVRHRICSFAQESTRYVNYSSKEIQFIIPVWSETLRPGIYRNLADPERANMKESPTDFEFVKSCLEDEKTYKRLIELGWKPQQAREVLPNALKTEIVVKANAREWRHIFSLRTAMAAHPQMRHLMIPLLSALKGMYPSLYGDLTLEE